MPLKFEELFNTINTTTDTFKEKDSNPSKQVLSVAEIKEKAGLLKLDYDAEQALKDAEIEKLKNTVDEKNVVINTLMDKVGLVDVETGEKKKDQEDAQKKLEEENMKAFMGEEYYNEYKKLTEK